MKNEMKTPTVCLSLEDYNDLFSDFDPRPYNERALSHDFLVEMKRATKDKPYSGIDLMLMMPKKKRNIKDEAVIKERLLGHFKKHNLILRDERNKIKKRGFAFVVSGLVIMFLAAYFFFEKSNYNIADKFLLTLLEPAGWFLFWEGLDQVVFEAKKKTPDFDFYKKMTKCKIIFGSY